MPSLREGTRTVGLFGLSANPPTGAGGHLGLVRWALAQTHVPIDALWVVPVYRHVFPEKEDLAAFEHRRAMCQLGLADPVGPRVVVCSVERDLAEAKGRAVGTAELLRFVQAEAPDVRWVLVLGQDTFQDLSAGRWREAEWLLSQPRLVAARAGLGDAGRGTQGVFAVDGLQAVSSSAARRARTRAELTPLVVPAVAAYIERHGLYGFARPEQGSNSG